MIIHVNTKSKVKAKKTKKSQALKDSWDKLLSKHSIQPNQKSNQGKSTYKLEIPRQTVRHPSIDNGIGKTTKPLVGNTYTGDGMIGISTMHKSNSVPVFRQSDAIDQAKMRRG